MDKRFIIDELKKENGIVYCIVGYDQDNNCLLTDWFGTVELEEIQEGGRVILELLQKHNITIWLNDKHQVVNSWRNASDWITNSWLPIAAEAGLKKVATVLPENKFGDFMDDNGETDLLMTNWQTEECAREWLLAGVVNAS